MLCDGASLVKILAARTDLNGFRSASETMHLLRQLKVVIGLYHQG